MAKCVISLMGALVLWLSTTAWAATYTITVSDKVDAVLTVLAQQNTPPNAPTWTAERYMQDMVRAMLLGILDNVRRSDATQACATYTTLTEAQKASIKGILGGKEPC